MCGIFACFNYGGDPKKFRKKMIELCKRMRHRGPDWSGLEITGNNCLGHERLSIMDVSHGDQPLKSHCLDSKVTCVANGEIYNHLKLRKQLKTTGHVYTTVSDCEIIMHLYEQFGDETPKYLDGDFAFVVFDGQDYLASRDPVGVDPLYQGWGEDGSIWFASEMKCLTDVCSRIISFPPGHSFSSRNKQLVQWYHPAWHNQERIIGNPLDLKALRLAFEEAVDKRLMCDVPYGVLLSGGLDSSLVASIMARHLKIKKQNYQNGISKAKIARMDTEVHNGEVVVDCLTPDKEPVLHSFSIGLDGSLDLKAAKQVAEFLGTDHHAFHFTVQEGIDRLSDVIYHLETYDVTTIRAGTPMYLLARRIKALGIKMVLSGEGSDEMFGGYLYFYEAPSDAEFHKESVCRVKNLHLSDCLRANKAPMASGLEVRVPFLDRDFLDLVMSLDPTEKRCRKQGRLEKYVLRKAFDTPDDPYLPEAILWRQKEQFSDGVGYSWIDSLKSHAEDHVTDEQMAKAPETYPYDTPATKEAYYYREIFESQFPNKACQTTVQRWIPRTDWGCSADPSGRAQKVHESALPNL